MEIIKIFSELDKNDVGLAGGKGASLGEMIQNEIPVPDGFVLLSTAFDRFLEITDLNVEIDSIIDSVDHNVIHTVEDASEKTQALILNSEIPDNMAREIERGFEEVDSEFVAVRSSATAEDSSSEAWAGQLDSFLNTTKEDLLENVKKCWASLFTPRAIFYRFETGLHKKKISVAVVVQKMIESEKSGIAFSVHPVTEDRNQLIIEAGFGLGEAIVSGSITPDSCVVEKDPRRIIDINVNVQNRKLVRLEGGGNEWLDLSGEDGNKQVLSEDQFLELAELIIKIENHYGFPCDIEWAFEDGRFYIVQSRPITTLSVVDDIYETSDEIVDFVKNNKFHKQFAYSFIPVICFESANYCYIENPLREELGIKNFPTFIVLWRDNYEDWGGGEVQKIRNREQIQFVIDENRSIVEKHEARVTALLETDYGKLTNNEIIEALEEIDRISVEIYHRYIYLIHDYLETDDEDLINVLPEVRIEMSEFVTKIYSCCDSIIKALSERFKDVCWETFTYATFEEIINLLKNPQSTEEFKKIYKRELVFVYDDEKISLIKDSERVDEVAKILDRQQGKIAKDVDVINGSSAFKGMARGNVVKISELDYKEVSKVVEDKDEYVLVAPMTRPEFVPFMKKAIAIVTDEGGITSHAAIVSRELKIPCIIGTKIATQVLNDGDLVEVDADNGVVRILEKAGSL
ncbi:PEP/pyruvate-binding domain-containing protein [Patescibacteria group bacterium]